MWNPYFAIAAAHRRPREWHQPPYVIPRGAFSGAMGQQVAWHQTFQPAVYPQAQGHLAPIPLPPGAIDPSQLCWDDYWMYALLPAFAEGVALYKGIGITGQVIVNMCVAGMRRAFWHALNNNWPCCGEDHPADAAFDRAEALAGALFEESVVEQARQILIPEIQSSNKAMNAGCPLQIGDVKDAHVSDRGRVSNPKPPRRF